MTIRRWLAVGALVLVALLYYRPLKAYVDARGQLGQRQAVVRRLEHQKQTLARRLGAAPSGATVAPEARPPRHIRPGGDPLLRQNNRTWREPPPPPLAPP